MSGKAVRIPASKKYGQFDPDNPEYVYIGRACYRGGWRLHKSYWANPYSIKEFGRAKSLEMYESMIRYRLSNHLEAQVLLSRLRGKKLACFCKPGEACHGDVLVKLIEEYFGEEDGAGQVASDEKGTP